MDFVSLIISFQITFQVWTWLALGGTDWLLKTATELYFAVFGGQPTFRQLVGWRVYQVYGYGLKVCSAYVKLWMSTVAYYVFSAEVVGTVVAFGSPFVIGWVIGKTYQAYMASQKKKTDALRRPFELVRDLGGPSSGVYRNVHAFDGHDGDLLKRITTRTAAVVGRLRELLSHYDGEDPTRRMKSDLVLQVIQEATGEPTIPESDAIWGVEKARKIWSMICDRIQSLEVAGCQESAQTRMAKELSKASGLDLLPLIVKAELLHQSFATELTNVAAIELLIPMLPTQFIYAALLDVNWDDLNFNWLSKRAQNWVRIQGLLKNNSRTAERRVNQPNLQPSAARAPLRVNRPPRRLCWNCGSPNHTAQNCPRAVARPNQRQFPPRNAARQVNQYRENDEEFENASVVEDPISQEMAAREAQEEIQEVRQAESSQMAGLSSITVPLLVDKVQRKMNNCSLLQDARKATHGEFFIQRVGREHLLLDTGAQVSVLPYKLIEKSGLSSWIDKSKQTSLCGFNGSKQRTEGVIRLGIKHGGRKCIVPFHVVNKDVEPILGFNAMSKLGVKWNLEENRVTVGGQPLPLISRN